MLDYAPDVDLTKVSRLRRRFYDYFRKHVPNAEAVCLPDIGHYPQLEAPDRVLAELIGFLDVAALRDAAAD